MPVQSTPSDRCELLHTVFFVLFAKSVNQKGEIPASLRINGATRVH
jgi:hypothetical protein